MDFIQPTTNVNPDGTERTRESVAEGKAISDGENERILMGFQKSGFGDKDFGFKVSQEGKDVKTAGDDELVMSSAFNLFKVVSTGTLNWQPFAGGDGFDYKTIAHNLGYIPIPLVYVDDGTYKYPLPYASGKTISAGRLYFDDYFDVAVDATNLYIHCSTTLSDPRPTFGFRYYLLRETAN